MSADTRPACLTSVGSLVIDQAEFGVVVFTAPLDGLGEFCGVGGGAYGTVGRVGIGGAYASGSGAELSDVFGVSLRSMRAGREVSVASDSLPSAKRR